ncbi:MAG: electron transfer flavoprotein subunit beta/FixA family protein [Candidatus Bathyarchaeia archaeon]
MNIIVLVKRIGHMIELDQDASRESSREPRINGTDKNAVEEAVRLREKYGGRVITITMGSTNSQDILRETLAIGADEAILLCDDSFEGADAHATVTVLEAAITKILDYDLIICGAYSDDMYAFQIGPRIAEVCNLPQITYATRIIIEGRRVIAERELEYEKQTVETKLPCLITVLPELNKPRTPSSDERTAASRKSITVWDAADLSLSEDEVGFNGSLVDVLRSTKFSVNKKPVTLQGEEQEVIGKIVDILKREGVLGEN